MKYFTKSFLYNQQGSKSLKEDNIYGLFSSMFQVFLHEIVFSSFWTKSRKSYCTTPGIAVGVGLAGGIGVSKMLKFLRSSFLCDGQVAVRRAMQ